MLGTGSPEDSTQPTGFAATTHRPATLEIPHRERPNPGKRGGVRYLANSRRKGSGSPIAVLKRSAVFLPESGGLSHRGPSEMHP